MDFFERPLPKDVKMKDINKIIDNNIIYEEYDYNVTILIDEYLENKEVKKLVKNIKENNLEIKPRIIYPFQIKDLDIKSNVVDYYSDNVLDLKKWIRPGEKVVVAGRILYSILKSDILEIKGFYDIIFNKSYFFDPKLRAYVYPVDSLHTWLKPYKILDDWERFFFHTQVKRSFIEEDRFYRNTRIKKIILDSWSDVTNFLFKYKNEDVPMACDIETKFLDPWNPESEILEVTISFDGKTGYLLPSEFVDKKLFAEFIKGKKLIMHNGKYDTKFFILKWSVPRKNIHIFHDTWSGSHLINEMQRSSLKSDSYLYTIHGGYDYELDQYLKKHPECKKDFSRIPTDVRYPYAVMDAIVTYQIYEKQIELFNVIDSTLKEHGVDLTLWNTTKYFYDVRMVSINDFLDIELNGMYVDWDLLKKYSKEVQDKLKKLEKEVFSYFNVEKGIISLTSGNELGTLFEASGWPCHGRSKVKPTKKVVKKIRKYIDSSFVGKEGYFLNGDEQLQRWKKEEGKSEIIKKILEYRKWSTVLKTFIGTEEDNSGFFQYRKSDNKIHSTFGPMMTKSHRHWSKDPNLQNMPKQDKELAKWYRRIFIPPTKEHLLVEQDAAGFQLRIGAIYSGDSAMKKVFTELGGDMHSMTGQSVLKRDMDLKKFIKLKKTDDEIKSIRFKAKGINFGLLFGMVAFTFAKNTIEPEWEKKEVFDYIRKYKLQEVQKRRYSLLMDSEGTNKRKEEIIEGNYDIFSDIEDKEYFSYCWVVASDIRDKFFETYKGLYQWHNITCNFADRHGFVISPFCAVRRLPQLLYQGKDAKKQRIKNLHNISLNSPVQNFEAVLMVQLMSRQNRYIKENNLNSQIFGNVHDANNAYVYKNELNDYIRISKEAFEENRPENRGIPQLLETNVADYENGEVWGFGTEV